MHTYKHTYMHTYIQTNIHTYIHTYLHTYTYIHAYIHIQMQACMQFNWSGRAQQAVIWLVCTFAWAACRWSPHSAKLRFIMSSTRSCSTRNRLRIILYVSLNLDDSTVARPSMTALSVPASGTSPYTCTPHQTSQQTHISSRLVWLWDYAMENMANVAMQVTLIGLGVWWHMISYRRIIEHDPSCSNRE